MSKLKDKIQKRQLCDSQTEKNAKKFWPRKKKLGKIDCRKHIFSNSTKIFASENLTPINESYVYNCCKLKHNGLIHGCFTRDGIVRIKYEERARPAKIFHIDKLHQLFPDFDFGNADDDDDMFLDASHLRFESTFQKCIMKNPYKILLVLVLPKCTPWLGLRDRGQKMSKFCMLYIAAGKLSFSNVN